MNLSARSAVNQFEVLTHHICMVLFSFIFRISIVTIFPLILSMLGQNTAALNYVYLLQENNVLLSKANASSCDFLEETVKSWLYLGVSVQNLVPFYNVTTFVLWAQLLPARCDFQRADGVITICDVQREIFSGSLNRTCEIWRSLPNDTNDATPEYYADMLDIRVGGITEYAEEQNGLLTYANGTISNETFSVRLLANENHVIAFV